jgi:hypothetical protein
MTTPITLDQQAANRARWIAALRSGVYEQGKNRLRHDNKFCCLGVACDLAQNAGIGRWDGDTFRTDGVDDYDGNDVELPYSVMEWLGITSPEGAWQNPYFESLTRMNDNGATFAEIADVIEAEPDGLIVR